MGVGQDGEGWVEGEVGIDVEGWGEVWVKS